MKIIKEGTVKPWIYVFECNNCGCIFEMDDNDPEDMDEMRKTNVCGIEYITTRKAFCPTCRHQVTGFQKEEEDG